MNRLGFVLLWAATTVSSALGQAPDWEAKAGGKMAFEVASVRLVQPGTATPFSITGAVFDWASTLSGLISFAYKLDPDQGKLMAASLPKWALSDRYAIQGKTDGTKATQDQMRLMVRALLEERFKLVVHSEDREMPVYALTLMKPGKTGLKLRPHAEGPACDAAAPSGSPPLFPRACETLGMKPSTGHMVIMGSRNTTLDVLASICNNVGQLGRPVVDRTGLRGRWDFTIEWAQEGPAGDGVAANDSGETTFLEALHEQLGLTIEPARASLKVMVVDHAEKPTEN